MIEVDKYIDSLETFKQRPDNFEKAMEELLTHTVLKTALAILEEQALLTEKALVHVEFETDAGRMKAIVLREKIKALRNVVEMIVNLANGE